MQLKNLKKLNRLLYLLNILDGGEIRVPREDGARKQAAHFLMGSLSGMEQSVGCIQHLYPTMEYVHIRK